MYWRNHAARSDSVEHHAHAHHALHVMVLSPPQEELGAHEAIALIDHETTALHPDGTDTTQV